MENKNLPAIGRNALALSTTWKTSPKACLEAINPGSVVEAIKSPSPAIGFFFQDSPAKAAAILSLLITDLVKFFNVGKTMNDFQVAQTVTLILQDENMRSLKPDDFKLCFNRMKKGHYGKSYDRIDGQIIFECLNLYLHERVTEAEQMSFKAHELVKEGLMAKPDPEGQKMVLKILKEAVSQAPKVEAEKQEVKKEKKVFEKSPRDHYIQKCFMEFFELHKKGAVKNSRGETTRFILYDGKEIDEAEYASIKLKEYDLINQNKDLEL